MLDYNLTRNDTINEKIHLREGGQYQPKPRHNPIQLILPPVKEKERIVRQGVLLETLNKFVNHPRKFHDRGKLNLQTWAMHTQPATPGCKVFMTDLDWGELTLRMTKMFGKTFAVLNMANAYAPGGGYLSGCAAQEENMFRRTDCHFSLSGDLRYTKEESALLNAKNNKVYLDIHNPRVCIRGREFARDPTVSCTRVNIGYNWLTDDDIFPFYELRAAAIDRRRVPDGEAWNAHEKAGSEARVLAMLNTLVDNKVRHVVLGAFGCGAFNNPTEDVAKIFKEKLETLASNFDVVAFGIYHAGYGPRNIDSFKKGFGNWRNAAPLGLPDV